MPLVGEWMEVEVAVESGTDQVTEQGATTADTGHAGVVVGTPEPAVYVEVANREDKTPYIRWKTWGFGYCGGAPSGSQVGGRLHHSFQLGS